MTKLNRSFWFFRVYEHNHIIFTKIWIFTRKLTLPISGSIYNKDQSLGYVAYKGYTCFHLHIKNLHDISYINKYDVTLSPIYLPRKPFIASVWQVTCSTDMQRSVFTEHGFPWLYILSSLLNSRLSNSWTDTITSNQCTITRTCKSWYYVLDTFPTTLMFYIVTSLTFS